MTIKTDLGYIEITSEVMAGIAGYAASSCFGVKGMTIRSMSDGLAHLLGHDHGPEMDACCLFLLGGGFLFSEG